MRAARHKLPVLDQGVDLFPATKAQALRDLTKREEPQLAGDLHVHGQPVESVRRGGVACIGGAR